MRVVQVEALDRSQVADATDATRSEAVADTVLREQCAVALREQGFTLSCVGHVVGAQSFEECRVLAQALLDQLDTARRLEASDLAVHRVARQPEQRWKRLRNSALEEQRVAAKDERVPGRARPDRFGSEIGITQVQGWSLRFDSWFKLSDSGSDVPTLSLATRKSGPTRCRLARRASGMSVACDDAPGVPAPRVGSYAFFGNSSRERNTHSLNVYTDGLADRALVSRVLGGDPEAIRAFSERLSCVPRFLGFLNRRLGRPLRDDSIDEVAQEVFVRIIDKLPEFEGAAKLESWLFRFCALTFQNASRATARQASRERGAEDGMDVAVAQDPETLAREDLLWVHSALDRLGDPDRGIVADRHFHARDFDDIANRIGMSVSAVKTRYYKALARMKEFLRPRFGQELEGGA